MPKETFGYEQWRARVIRNNPNWKGQLDQYTDDELLTVWGVWFFSEDANSYGDETFLEWLRDEFKK